MFQFDLDSKWADDLGHALLSAAWEEQEKSWSEQEQLARERGEQYRRPLPQMVDRVEGLRICILADEHPPPHFHVDCQGTGASFSILTGERLPGTKGLEREEKAIRAWWKRNRSRLVQVWNDTRPTNCPVGPVVSP